MTTKTKIWKTVTVGESKTSLKKKLKDFNVSSYAKNLFEKMPVSKKEKVDLILLTPKDLGFTDNPTTTELFKRAKERGYDLCPADVGPILRVTYTDQPVGEWLYIAMEPITDSDGGPGVWGVGRHSGDSWLRTRWSRPDRRWNLDRLVVFRARKSFDPSPLGIESSDSLALESAIKICKEAGYQISKIL